MKKQFLKTILILLCGAAALVVWADTEFVDGVTWTFKLSNGNAYVTSCSPCVNRVIVPSTLGGCPVTALSTDSFSGKGSLISVELPNTLQIIGQRCFRGSSIQHVNFPSSITLIDEMAFEGCGSLEEAILPDSVTTFKHSWIFSGCGSLKTVRLPSNLTELPGGVFADCVSLTSVDLPATITSLGGCAFRGCTGLKSIIIPEGGLARDAFLDVHRSNPS